MLIRRVRFAAAALVCAFPESHCFLATVRPGPVFPAVAVGGCRIGKAVTAPGVAKGTAATCTARPSSTTEELEGNGKSEAEIAQALAGGKERRPCFYKPDPNGRKWKQRTHIDDLSVGQHLTGYVVQEHTNGKTGPKLFFECGVGRTNATGDWSMVRGMMRIKRDRVSVLRKRVARIRKAGLIDLYVSRIFAENGRFEVCRSAEDVELARSGFVERIPVKNLKPSAIVEGQVVRLEPYGAIVDVGASHHGLLHIRLVADLYDQYIDKEDGLAKAGLEKGARVRLMVLSNTKKRLALDFTNETKEAFQKEREYERERLGRVVRNADGSKPAVEATSAAAGASVATATAAEPPSQVSSSTALSPAQTASQSGSCHDDDDDDDDDDDEVYDAYAEYAAEYANSYTQTDDQDDADTDPDYDDYDSDEDDDDEDRSIEDALGLGTY